MRSNFLTAECDNKKEVHNPVIFNENPNGLGWYCRNCNRTGYLRKDKDGSPHNKEYLKIFYRDVVQSNKPLYYKIHPEKMSVW